MAGQVKGVTIEFDGSTVKLETAINKIKQLSYSTEQELKAVNRNLKFDPKNTELLSVKQELLKQRIEESKEQLKDFHVAQNQLRAQKVEKNSKEWLKAKRNILEAEGKLRTFNAQLARLQWKPVTDAGKAIKTAGQNLSRATKYARAFVGTIGGVMLFQGLRRLEALDEVKTQMAALGYSEKEADKNLKAVSNSVQNTKFMLQDMGRVAAAALGSGVTKDYKLEDYLKRVADLSQLTGLEVEDMGAILNKAYSKGAVDARAMFQLNQHSIPIYKLLQQELGVSAEKLREMSREGKITFDDLYRATDKYKDLAVNMGAKTLPGAVRVLSQQLSVIGADFLEGVYDPIKGGVQDIVNRIKSMVKSGVFKEWGKDIGDAAKYFIDYFKNGSADIDNLSERSQNLVKVLAPLVQTIGDIVKVLAGLPPEIQGLLIFTTLLGGPMLTAVGTAVSGFGSLAANIQTVGMNASAGVLPTTNMAGAVSGLGTAAHLLINPLTLSAGAFLVFYAAIQQAHDELHGSTDAMEEFKKATDEEVESVKTENEKIDLYKDKLDELMAIEDKSKQEKELIKEYVDRLNDSVENLNIKYDEEKDKLNETSDAIQKKIDKYKEAALAAVYEERATEATKKIADENEKLIGLYEKRKELQDIVKANTNENGQVTGVTGLVAAGDLATVNKQIQDSKNAIAGYKDEINGYYQTVDNLSASSQDAWTKIINQAEKAGAEIPEIFRDEVAAGMVEVPKSLDELYQKMDSKYSGAIQRAKSAGVKIPKSITKGINSGKLSPSQAVEKIDKLVQNKANNDAKNMNKPGELAMNSVAKGMGSKSRTVSNKSKETMNSAKKSAGSVSMFSVGADWARGFINGIGSMIKAVGTAARNFVRNAINNAKKEGDSHSPSRVMRKVGRDFGKGYVLGIQDENRAAAIAGGNLVRNTIRAATVPASQVTTHGTGSTSSDTNISKNNSINNTFIINGANDANNVAETIAQTLEMQMRME